MRALVFPGQGVQRRGMGTELFPDYPDLVSQADRILGYSIVELCRDDPGGRLRDTRYAQPAIFVVNALAWLQRQRTGPTGYAYLAGHSLGEYNALVAAGVLPFPEALALVAERAELMAGITGGGMVAVAGLDPDRIEAALAAAGLRRVHVANRNSDQQAAIAGDRTELAAATRAVRAAGARQVTPLAVSGPFHSPMMAPAGRMFRRTLRRYQFSPAQLPVISSVTGQPFDVEQAAELLSRQIAAPVEWVRTVHALRTAGVEEIDEVNGQVLTGLIAQIGVRT